MSFGDLLKKARITAGLSQVELALKIGVAKSTLSLYESNKREPDVETIKKIASALDVDPNYLLGIERTVSKQQLSNTELEIIKKYRQLDLRGQQAVLDTLNREYSYIEKDDMIDMSMIASDAIDTIDKISENMFKNQHDSVRKK